MPRRNRLAVRPILERLDDRCLLSAVTPAQLDSAYGISAITYSNGAVKGDGEGQTIAIVDAYSDPTIVGDLAAFDAKYGIANPTTASAPALNRASSTSLPTFTVVDQAGSSTDSGWNMEEALDVEMAHAAAPGANIVLVEARSASTTDLMAAVNAARSLPGVSVVSMSWGGSEFGGQQAYDVDFTTPIGHTGITFLASAGDSGAGAEWPASSAKVVGVGGTSLVVTSAGARGAESAWSGTGGGVSQYVSKPSYQASVVSGAFRSAPDVSLDADPNSGVVIVSQGSQVQVGGTSLSAPVWGGLIAIADQGLALDGKASLDGPSQTLPDLYKAPAGSFYDVTGGARSTIGYDTSTGLGTPNAPTLVAFLSGTATTTTGGGTTGGGTTGGGTTGGGTTGGGTTGGGSTGGSSTGGGSTGGGSTGGSSTGGGSTGGGSTGGGSTGGGSTGGGSTGGGSTGGGSTGGGSTGGGGGGGSTPIKPPTPTPPTRPSRPPHGGWSNSWWHNNRVYA